MDIEQIYENLILNASLNNFRGIDPYDFASSGLKFPSKITPKMSFLNKISPINLRSFIGVSNSHNTKSNALFLSSLSKLPKEKFNEEIYFLKNWLISNPASEFEEFSVGFAFDMALSRYKSGPGKTSLIISLYCMFSFFDLYNKTKDEDLLEKIKSFKSLLDNKWLTYEDNEKLWYSYLPKQKDEVYNATAKVGRFYAMHEQLFPNVRTKKVVSKILAYLQSVQNKDGSWCYSAKAPYVDHFHTVFILESMYEMHKIVSNRRSLESYERGLLNYKENCFKGEKPLHFHKKRAPKDIRSRLLTTEVRDIANAIIFFSKIGDINRADTLLGWSLKNFYDKKGSYFYFYENSLFKSKINYIRWQGWMALAISELLNAKQKT